MHIDGSMNATEKNLDCHGYEQNHKKTSAKFYSMFDACQKV